jgi:kelch-like protein 9/13
MEQILDFIYTGSIHITFDNILNTLAFASHLQIEILLDLCSQFLVQNLKYSNCVHILKIADFYMLPSVLNLAQSFLCENIIAIYEQASDQFIQLNYEHLKTVLNSQSLKSLSDLDLFLMLVKWIQPPARLLKHDLELKSRLSCAKEIMKYVRFMCMSADELCDWVESVSFMHSIPECKAYLTEAYRWHALPKRQPLIDSEQARLRGQDVLIAVGETNIFALNEQKAQWDIVASAPLDENYRNLSLL